MRKSILNLGNALNKAEQRSINGGFGSTGPGPCTVDVCQAGARGEWLFDPGCECDGITL